MQQLVKLRQCDFIVQRIMDAQQRNVRVHFFRGKGYHCAQLLFGSTNGHSTFFFGERCVRRRCTVDDGLLLLQQCIHPLCYVSTPTVVDIVSTGTTAGHATTVVVVAVLFRIFVTINSITTMAR